MATKNVKSMDSWAFWAIVAMTLGPLAVMPMANNTKLAQQAAPAEYGAPAGPQMDAPMSPEGAAV
jgi:hypothetical protein